MVPDVIAPDPGADGFDLELLEEELDVVPPQAVLAADDIFEMRLVDGLFFVHAKVKKARAIEQVDHLGDQVGADVVILWCRYPARVVPEPLVVAG